MYLPESVELILNMLNNNGYSAYVVGGSVRDAFMDKTPKDYDIATSAFPEQVMETFKDFEVIPTGLKHGTVTVVVDKKPIEVTSYRLDGNYTDGRHPDEVVFTDNIDEDLARRDFTINAIAYNHQEGYHDVYGGIADIQNGTIRCVGNPEGRFKEDGLRILRAMRFAAQLGFNIEKNTSKAMHDCKYMLDNISRERIQSELVKILMSDNASGILISFQDILLQIIPEMEPMVNFYQDDHYYEYNYVLDHALHCLGAWDLHFHRDEEWNDIILRLALLLHDVGKPSTWEYDEYGYKDFDGHNVTSAIMARKILKSLKFSNDIVSKVCQLIDYHCFDFDGDFHPKVAAKLLLNEIGETQLRRLIALQLADLVKQHLYFTDKRRWDFVLQAEHCLEKIIENDECYSLKQLAINGDDLINAGFEQGQIIGVILDVLLNTVIEEKVENSKEALLNLAKTTCFCTLAKEDTTIGSC